MMMIGSNKKKRKRKNKNKVSTDMQKMTYTKKAITGIIVVALIDIQLPFILAFLGREQIAEDLGKLIVAEIIGVFLTYCLKSFFETREEALTRIKEKAMETPLGVEVEFDNDSEESTEAIAE